MPKMFYYDEIFADSKGMDMYEKWVRRFLKPGDSICEFACGSGDLIYRLQEYDSIGIDIDPQMIEAARKKYPELKERFKVGSFFDWESTEDFNLLLCFNDSLNYIKNVKELENFVDNSLKCSNELLLDSHHPYRLEEFSVPYLEEGSTESFDYAYQINCENDHLIHIISFLDGRFDYVYQWVFSPNLLINLYESRNCTVEVYTDFKYKGILSKGEKVMYHVKKNE